MAAALDHVAQLGTFDPIEIARQRQRLSFLGRDMRQTHPRGVLADSATVIAEYHPQYKTWDEAEGAVLALCDNHGVRGAGDPNVLAEADGMRGVKAFKKKRRTLEKKLGGRVVTGSRARRSE